jgi:hypothetical protein
LRGYKKGVRDDLKDGIRPSTNKPSRSAMQGQAAVHLVAAHVLMLGHIPLFPDIDYGYDIKLDNGLRLQVKSSRLQKMGRSFPAGGYRFNFRKNSMAYGKRVVGVVRDYTAVADFFVLWGVDENRFWIVPCSKKHTSLFIPAKNDGIERTPWLDFHKIKELHDSGMNNSEIGRLFNVSHNTIRLTLKNGESRNNEHGSTRHTVSLEGRWDLLDLDKASQNLVESVTPATTEVTKLLDAAGDLTE